MKIHSVVLIFFSSTARLSSSFLVLNAIRTRTSTVGPASQFISNAGNYGRATLYAAAADQDQSSIEELRRDADVIFSIIDSDGSGSISREEMTSHLSDAGYTEEVIDKIFNKLDTNKDSEISKEEFRRGFVIIIALRSAPGLGNFNSQFEKEIYEDADQVFQSADADGDGEIDESELKSHLGRRFGKFSDEATENIFRMLDVNGDRTISREEFRDAFVRYAALRQAIGEGPNYK
jgi:Ca2+-binding EF-hand superfamily protein